MPVIPAVTAPALATPAELEVLLQRTFTEAEASAAELLLDLVSGAIRSYTGQFITVATTTDRIKVTSGRVGLPQRPVSEVSAVANVSGTTLLHTWDAGPQVWLSSCLPVANGPSGHRAPSYVDVTYTHGYATVPADIRAVALQVAARSMGAAADQTGMQSEAIGGYSYSMGAAAAQGVVGFMAGERAVLDRYKMPAGPIRMERR